MSRCIKKHKSRDRLLQLHRGPGLPLGMYAGTSITLALPQARQRLCTDRKHTPGATKRGVPLGWSNDNTELKLERPVKYQTIPFVLTGLCLLSSGETEGSLAVDFLSWTLSEVLIFNYVPPDSLRFLLRQVPQTQNCKALRLGGQKAWNNT